MDNENFRIALEEVESPSRNAGLWARAFAEANGNQDAAKATYVRYRAEELASAAPNAEAPTAPSGKCASYSTVTDVKSPSSTGPNLNDDCWDASPRPWRRFWARFIDNAVFGLVVFLPSILLLSVISGSPGVAEAFSNPLVAMGVFIPLTMACESVCYAMGFRSPGKAIMGLRLISNVRDKNPSAIDILERAGHVWLRGMWLGVPLISLIGMALAAGYLRKHGVAAWDRPSDSHAGYRVEACPMTLGRGLVAGVVITVIFVALGILNMLGQ